ncbi:hypothetical protein ACHAWF_006174 [Thalassiosira exigua]
MSPPLIGGYCSLLLGGRRLTKPGNCFGKEEICKKDASVVFYYSSYLRTKQTLNKILPFFNDKEVISCLQEPRIASNR